MAGNWYNDNWKMRWPVAISALGGGGAGNVDVSIIIPSDWDLFWLNVNDNLQDIVPVTASGDLIPFKRLGHGGSAASKANRNLQLDLDAVDVGSQDATSLIYIYWLNSGASDQATTPSISSAKTGTVFLGTPTGRVVQMLPNRAVSEAPQTSFSKTTNDEVNVWFSVAGLFMNRKSTFNGRRGYEDIRFVKVRSLASNGSDDAGRYDETKTEFIPGWIKVRCKAGSNNTDYTLECLVTTTLNQVISLRCLIKVRDLLPT